MAAAPKASPAPVGFKVQGLRLRVLGLGFRVYGFRVQGSEFEAKAV